MNNHVSEITLFLSLHLLPQKTLQMLGLGKGERGGKFNCPTLGAHSCPSRPWALAAASFLLTWCEQTFPLAGWGQRQGLQRGADSSQPLADL